MGGMTPIGGSTPAVPGTGYTDGHEIIGVGSGMLSAVQIAALVANDAIKLLGIAAVNNSMSCQLMHQQAYACLGVAQGEDLASAQKNHDAGVVTMASGIATGCVTAACGGYQAYANSSAASLDAAKADPTNADVTKDVPANLKNQDTSLNNDKIAARVKLLDGQATTAGHMATAAGAFNSVGTGQSQMMQADASIHKANADGARKEAEYKKTYADESYQLAQNSQQMASTVKDAVYQMSKSLADVVGAIRSQKA